MRVIKNENLEAFNQPVVQLKVLLRETRQEKIGTSVRRFLYSIDMDPCRSYHDFGTTNEYATLSIEQSSKSVTNLGIKLSPELLSMTIKQTSGK